jgi:hypothetical protein
LNLLRTPASAFFLLEIKKIAIFALGGCIYYIIKGDLHCFKRDPAEASYWVGVYKTKLLKM